MSFVSALEGIVFSAGIGMARSGGRQPVRVIRTSNRPTIDRLIAALRDARAERDALVQERDRLMAQVGILRCELAAHVDATRRPLRLGHASAKIARR
ncbi:MAG TPA: hypothetical protein ENH55_01400 [Aurantimonas coralicida]|uniref:Uncharacterized protein n=2 Tax=root TaxID=1 RepID=A0A9C9THE2_9HYPH|nr:hypothetical protein [Aurantimonas coralicida]HEU01232.1 hypothetical protein [Aurantimonas coralicida]